jgi:putative membrane protein
MEYIDLILAILHHLLVFSLAAIIAMESLLVRQELSHGTISLLARIDRHYGMIAGAVILIGIGRVLFGLRGWEYYVYYWAFWAKMAAFAAVGLLSIPPTMRFLAWSRAAAKDSAFRVPATELAVVQRYVRAEVVVFLLIPTFAAIMARGVGY